MKQNLIKCMQELNKKGFKAFDIEHKEDMFTVSNEQENKNPFDNEYTSEWNQEFKEICNKNNCEFDAYDSGTIHVYNSYNSKLIVKGVC